MSQSPHHDPHGGASTLSDTERIYMRAGIDDLDMQLLTCRDTGLWRELTRMRRHMADELAAGRRLPLGDDTSIWYDFEITPLLAEEGAVGWKLRLLQDGVAVGGSVFPVIGNDGSFLPWWTSQTQEEQTRWLMRTATSSAAEAYLIHLLDKGWHDAFHAAGEWLDSRPK